MLSAAILEAFNVVKQIDACFITDGVTTPVRAPQL
jgi:hypothetical protein